MFQQETFDFEGISVPSGVQDQPMNDSTSLTGALNRDNNAMAKIQHTDYWVGIEGGIELTGEK